ncbi:hypothetical protein BJ994_003567 [Arthrobacter pigmenti]|uniref:Uncharacterized protein n=1 Tax=Arthrobacter pigmenti TaxID=271432 RepID=A0A846S235_9MICC|nr:hypothetical protein [Arthrobacter pigmenti]NJC24491.1 hypothetical protein [Arthrobacter pigmenti]
MIADLTRRPGTPAELAADAVRGVAVLCTLAMVFWWGAVDVAVFVLALGGLTLSRYARAHPVFDLVYGCALIFACWSSVLNLYTLIPWWDLLVHCLCTGPVAAMAYVLAAHVGLLPGSRSRVAVVLQVLQVLLLGIALSVLWEFAEWAAHSWVDEDIYVTYSDTMGDLAVGALGSLAAGVLLSALSVRRARTRLSSVRASRSRR